ncbi:MAG TPA: hypothetical protein VGA31_10215 [Thermoanaerobaculia bacterium]
MNTVRCPRSWFAFALFLSIGIGADPAFASLVFTGVSTGNVNSIETVLTIQNAPTEQGCVGWNGAANVIGSAVCPGGLSPAITGGNEKTGKSQTQTRTVASAALTSGQSLAVILDVTEPGGSLLTVENLSLTVYSPSGTVLFNSGNMVGAGVPPGGGITIESSSQGQSGREFKFVLDTTQATAISPFICRSEAVAGCAGVANPANGNNRIGVAAILTNSQGGAETFSIADVAGQ